MLLSNADILVKALIEQGCDTVFVYPGVRSARLAKQFIDGLLAR